MVRILQMSRKREKYSASALNNKLWNTRENICCSKSHYLSPIHTFSHSFSGRCQLMSYILPLTHQNSHRIKMTLYIHVCRRWKDVPKVSTQYIFCVKIYLILLSHVVCTWLAEIANKVHGTQIKLRHATARSVEATCTCCVTAS